MGDGDSVLELVRDKDLLRTREKTSRLLRLIDDFPLSELRISKLCHRGFEILQRLERISLQLNSWEFMSLRINGESHFQIQDSTIKEFNTMIAGKVLVVSNDLNVKLAKVAHELAIVSKQASTLTPREYINDSGTVLSSLLLKCVRLKSEAADKLTISYSMAKLIQIGQELEEMVSIVDKATVDSYKAFILSILKQLEMVLEEDDAEGKQEWMAIVNDMLEMYEAFKTETMKNTMKLESDEYEESSAGSYMNMLGVLPSPMVHSITKHEDEYGLSSTLTKTSISEELPYMMSAFDSAKNFEEDVSHFRKDQPKQVEKKKRPHFSHKHNLPDRSLYSESVLLKNEETKLLVNGSLLSKLGIRPQVIQLPRIEEREKENNNALTEENLERFSLTNLNKKISYDDLVD